MYVKGRQPCHWTNKWSHLQLVLLVTSCNRCTFQGVLSLGSSSSLSVSAGPVHIHIYATTASRTILQGTLEGWRHCFQTRKWWMDNTKEWTSLPMPELLMMASHRKDWRRISAELCLILPHPHPLHTFQQPIQSSNWTVGQGHTIPLQCIFSQLNMIHYTLSTNLDWVTYLQHRLRQRDHCWVIQLQVETGWRNSFSISDLTLVQILQCLSSFDLHCAH